MSDSPFKNEIHSLSSFLFSFPFSRIETFPPPFLSFSLSLPFFFHVSLSLFRPLPFLVRMMTETREGKKNVFERRGTGSENLEEMERKREDKRERKKERERKSEALCEVHFFGGKEF